jgi:predicted Zn-dependent protease
MSPRRRILATGCALALLAGCSISTSPSSSPPTGPGSSRPRADRPRSTRTVDAAQAQRLQRLMLPLVKAMNSPRPLNQVKIGILDDDSINAANAGGGEFYVTTGLLERARDDQLLGVLAHEVAHDDLGHVAKAQAIGTGINIGTIILDQIIPGSGAIAPIAGELLMRGYTRKEEYAADRHGAELLERVGRDRQLMIDTLSWLLKTTGGSGGGFLATHPATGDRIEALRQAR